MNVFTCQNVNNRASMRAFALVICGSCLSCLGKAGEKKVKIILFIKNSDRSSAWEGSADHRPKRSTLPVLHQSFLLKNAQVWLWTCI